MKLFKLFLSFVLLVSLIGCSKKEIIQKEETKPQENQKDKVETRDLNYYLQNLSKLKYDSSKMLTIIESDENNLHYVYKFDETRKHSLIELYDLEMKKPPVYMYDFGESTIMMLTLEIPGYDIDTYYEAQRRFFIYENYIPRVMIIPTLEQLISDIENIQFVKSEKEDGKIYDYISFEWIYADEFNQEEIFQYKIKVDTSNNEIVQYTEEINGDICSFKKGEISIGEQTPVLLSDETFANLIILASLDLGAEL